MSRLFIVVGGALLLVGCTALSGGYERYENKHDKFNNMNVYSWSADSGTWYTPRVNFYAAAAPGSAPRSVLATIRVTTSSWTYLRCNNVVFLADGERITGPTKHDGTVGYSSAMRMAETYEAISMTLPVADAAKIAQAGTVEYQVCTSEYKLDPKDQAGLQRVLAESGAAG